MSALLGLAFMVIAGDAVVSWLRPSLATTRAGRIGLACLIGPFIVSFACFVINLAGVPFGPGLSWGVTLAAWGAWAVAKRSGRNENPPYPKAAQPQPSRNPSGSHSVGASGSVSGKASAPFWLLLAGPIVIGALLAVTIPPVKDSLVNWSLKTHILLKDGTMFTPDFKAEHRYLFHTNYPPLVPIAQVYLYGIAGEAIDRQAKLVFTLFHIGAAFLLLGFFRRRLSGWLPVAIAAIGAAIPHFYRTDGLYRFGGSVASGYAEPAFAALAFACVAATVAWLESRAPRDAALAGLFLGASLFTKQEGLALGVSIASAAAIALLFSKVKLPKPASLVAAGLSCATFAVPWFLYRRTLPEKDENYLHRLTDLDIVTDGLWRIPTILICTFEEALNLRHHGLIWPLLIIMLCVAGRRVLRPQGVCPAVTISIMSTLYFAVFVVTPLPVVDLLYTSIPRTFFQLDLIALLLVGILLTPTSDDLSATPVNEPTSPRR